MNLPNRTCGFAFRGTSASLIFTTLILHFAFSVTLISGQDKTVKVFIFAGQSNMVGSDSKAGDIKNFPPFVGLDKPQEKVRFSYCIGRENKKKSDGWVKLQPVNEIVGPELSFARMISRSIEDPIAIIKVAAGGTHLGGDWNPDRPSGFKMYPLALSWIRSSLEKLKERGVSYQIEAFFWHQGENDMFNEEYMKNYGKNLENYLACWRRDLNSPDLKFFIGELCTKTIWGMDLRPKMYAISQGQKSVTEKDPLATYVPTAHVGVEIGGGVGLHYHYGTLGQLQHGENYARAYLQKLGLRNKKTRKLPRWPYQDGTEVNLYILAGHRNMEGERAFVQQLMVDQAGKQLAEDNDSIAFKYNLGGGYQKTDDWEPLGLTGFNDTFGPELSFARRLLERGKTNVAIAKFTHSGSQIIDWTPDGSIAKDRMLYAKFIKFIQTSIEELERKGHAVRLAAIVYHTGENDMSFYPYRREAARRIQSMIRQSRIDLKVTDLKWIVSQQPPTDDQRVNKVDVMTEVKNILAEDKNAIHLPILDLPKQEKKLVIDTKGMIHLGVKLADATIE